MKQRQYPHNGSPRLRLAAEIIAYSVAALVAIGSAILLVKLLLWAL